MSDIFETDIDTDGENLSSLEDSDVGISETENLVFDYPLFHLKLDYSCETIYAKAPEGKLHIQAGDFVIGRAREVIKKGRAKDYLKTFKTERH